MNAMQSIPRSNIGLESQGRLSLSLSYRPRLFILLACLVLPVHLSIKAATLPSGFAESQVASGISNPTAMAFAPDGRLFVCQQGGQLRVIKDGALLATPFLTVTTDSSGERGLLGIAFDPNFTSNQYVYIYYTATTPTIHNRVSRFTANGDVAVPGSEAIILELNNLTGATNHNGGAMNFGSDGKLYIAVGENANPSHAQTLANLLGKMLRINRDGTIPTDNPFYTQATGINRAIWTLGLRNPFTFAFQPGSGRMFINDVGQSAWEEINDGIAGANYGWPACEGGCGQPSYRDPVYQYPNDGQTCAITGGTFYNSTVSQFPSEYVGKYFFADFCGGWIRRLDPATGAATNFASGISLPVDLKVGPDGSLYYLARGSGGTVYKVQYTASQPPTPTALQFSSASYNVEEGGHSLDVTVVRTGSTSGAVTIDFATGGGTASERSDYITALGTLRFADGETIKTFSILLIDDVYDEGNETVNLSLSNPTGGASLGSQSTAVLTISDNDFAPGAPNPISGAQFFVRQHYLDFLNRLPDLGGLDYWTTQITNCGASATCIETRRTDISAAFFIEQEFQQTGYLVYRLYKGAFGRLPNFTEFMRDRSRLIGGPDLLANRQALASEWTMRPAFLGVYPATMTPEEYVNRLFDTAGLFPYTVERQQLAQDMRQGRTRAQALLDMIEIAEFRTREYNPAFVLMQYFGYLRRDADAGGYAFWLDVLNNRDRNNFRGMVGSFITSREYRDRFGPF